MSGFYGALCAGAQGEEVRGGVGQRSAAAPPPPELLMETEDAASSVQAGATGGAGDDARRGASAQGVAVADEARVALPSTASSLVCSAAAPPGAAATFSAARGASTNSTEAVMASTSVGGDALNWGEHIFVPGGSIASIVLNYVPIKRAAHIASISSVLRDTVMAHAWRDEFTEVRDVAAWHAAFPSAVACSVAKEANLRDADCAHLAHVRMLTLPAGTCELTDAGFAQLRALEELRMNWIKLRHCCPLLFTHLREVRVLHMSGWRCGALTPDMVRTLHRVVELDLSCNPSLDDEVLAAVPYSCATLNISLCRRITAAGIARLTQVRDLDLSYNSDLAIDAVLPLSSSLRTLRVLSSSPACTVLPDAEKVLPGVTVIRTA